MPSRPDYKKSEEIAPLGKPPPLFHFSRLLSIPYNFKRIFKLRLFQLLIQTLQYVSKLLNFEEYILFSLNSTTRVYSAFSLHNPTIL